MATNDLGLAGRLEKAINAVNAVMHGLQEMSAFSDFQSTLHSFANVLEAAEPAMDEALALLQKAQEVANG